MNKIKLSDLANVVMGQSPKGETCNFVNIGAPLLNGPTEFGDFYPKAKQFTTEGKKFSVKEDILFCVRGSTTGRMNISDSEYVLGRGLAAIRHKMGVKYNTYLRYLIEYNLSSILKVTSGSTFPNLTSNNLLGFKFLVPDSIDQLKISKFLSDLDSKIAINNKINQELEAMAKTLYDYWFVQFDFPDKNGKPYKSSEGKMIFNEDLKREIPVGWENKTIGDYCKSSGGYAFKSSMWSDKGAFVVKIKDIQEDYTINLSGISYADLSGREIDEKFISKPGDVLIAMTGATVGKYAIVPFTKNPLYINQRVGYFDLGSNPTNKLPFLINSLNQKYFRDVIFKVATGAAQPNISNNQINNIKLITPTKDLLEIYNSKMKSSYDKILNNQRENQKLSELRDWLLPMLMNGQVSVGEK
ncbi:restriction endonuclease subunit S [Tenacibaculum dicentrarchi]|nr:restriction endonuclease subunit S [Tenacibaculum dicentrarchi]